jgi:hypothetical protein
MDLKTLYLLILGITITILTHTIFKTPAPIKEGFFDAIIKLVRDIQNIICFIRWFINRVTYMHIQIHKSSLCILCGS